jgi:thioredoxin 1
MSILLANTSIKTGSGSMIVTDSSFDDVVSSNGLVLMDFWAEWCGPCKKLGPILEEISNETGLLVGKLNIDENQEKTRQYSVQSIPTMVLFKDGNPVHTLVGAMPKHRLLKELAEWI